MLTEETLLVLTEGGRVTYATASPTSRCVPPEKGSPFDAKDYASLGAKVGSVGYGHDDSSKTLHAVQFDPSAPTTLVAPATSFKEVLAAILDNLGVFGTARQHLQQVIASIVGYANNLAEQAHRFRCSGADSPGAQSFARS